MDLRTSARIAGFVMAAVVAPLVAGACSSGGSGTAASGSTKVSAATSNTSAPGTTQAPSTSGGAVDPNAPEVVAPGDIPDNQVFVAYNPPTGRFSVKVPEGWSRTSGAAAVTFTDNYNSITVQSGPAASPPTVDSVRSVGLSDVSGDPTFHLNDVQPVTRKAGTGVVAHYEIGSAPNTVTGKKALLAVERYVFSQNGTEVVLTLSGAKGADNVDPWKTVSDSLAWG